MEYKNLIIKWGGNSGFLIKASGLHIFIDPFKLNDIHEKADLILITHGHYDHCSIEDIKRIVKFGTRIIGPSEILSQVSRFDGIDFEIAEPGKKMNFNGIGIECAPAYNINKHFHPKEEGYVGYILDLFGVRVYHAGDSDFIPEMIKINADVVMLPIDGKFAMSSEYALKAAQAIKPDFAIPMHFGSVAGTKKDAERFAFGCRELGIDSRVLSKEI